MNVYALKNLKITILNRQISLQWSRSSNESEYLCVVIIDESMGKQTIICKKPANYTEKVEIPNGHYSVWRVRVIAFGADAWVDDTVMEKQEFWTMLRRNGVSGQSFLIGTGSIRYHIKVTPLKGPDATGMDQITLTVKTQSSWGPGVLEYGYDQQRFPLPKIEKYGKMRYPAFLVPKGAIVELSARYAGSGIDIQRHQGLFMW